MHHPIVSHCVVAQLCCVIHLYMKAKQYYEAIWSGGKAASCYCSNRLTDTRELLLHVKAHVGEEQGISLLAGHGLCFLNVFVFPYSTLFSEMKHTLITDPSVRLSIHSLTFPSSGHGGTSLSREAQTSQIPPPAPLGEYQGVPRPAEKHIVSNVSWVCPGASSWQDMPRTPLNCGIQGASSRAAQTTSTGSCRCEGAIILHWVSPGSLYFSSSL